MSEQASNVNRIHPGREVLASSRRKHRKSTERGSSILAGKTSDHFPGEFLFFPTGTGRKSSGKCSKNFRPKYCFHVPLLSGIFLREPEVFPALSYRFCSIRWPERSTWARIIRLCWIPSNSDIRSVRIPTLEIRPRTMIPKAVFQGDFLGKSSGNWPFPAGTHRKMQGTRCRESNNRIRLPLLTGSRRCRAKPAKSGNRIGHWILLPCSVGTRPYFLTWR